MEDTHSLQSLPDDELLRRLSELLRQSRRTEADLVAHIGEVDARRLYARTASPSMFAWCTEVLHLSEFEAYLRITVARAARRHPLVLTMLREGSLHLSGAARLAPHLTPDEGELLLKRAAHKSKREIEELVAEIAPRPDAPALMRKLPGCRPKLRPSSVLKLGPERVEPAGLKVASPDNAAGAVPTGAIGAGDRSASTPEAARPHPEAEPLPSPPVLERRPSGRVQPLAPARYKVQFTASAELRDKLERLQALMRSSVPDGDLAAIIDAAVSEKLERLEARRFARTKAPRKGVSGSDTSPSSRHVPAAVRRAVYERDDGRCSYVDEQGRRCTARDGLEFHHRHPFGHGGSHSTGNVSLACRVHNLYLAELDYGREAMARHWRPRTDSPSLSLPT